MFLVGLGSFFCSGRISPHIVDKSFLDVLFDADYCEVYELVSDRWSSVHRRTAAHPLFSLATTPFVYVIRGVLAVETLTALRIFLAGASMLWIGLFYWLLRALEVRRLDSVVFSVVLSSSAAAVFWCTTIEFHLFSSLSLIAALLILRLGARARSRECAIVFAGVVSLSMLVTNWMLGIIASFRELSWRRALQMNANALCIVCVLFGAQKVIFPKAGFFIGDTTQKSWLAAPTPERVADVLMALSMHSFVMPDPVEVMGEKGRRGLRTQGVLPGSGSVYGFLALGCWLFLLAVGTHRFVRSREFGAVGSIVGLTIIGQLALFSIYGRETFLYAINVAPLLVMVTVCGTKSRLRPVVLGVAILFSALALVNNYLVFEKVRSYAAGY